MNLDDFMAANPPPKKASPLKQHKDALCQLRRAGYTGKQIREYLLQNGIDVSEPRICQFFSELGMRKNTTTSDSASPTPVPKQETRRHAPKPIPTPTPSPAPGDDVSPTQMAEYAELARLGRKSTQ
jgi:hypothetical protein